MKQIKFNVTGTITGFIKSGETEQQAIGRIFLEAEAYGNSRGTPRIHLKISDEDLEIKNTVEELYTGNGDTYEDTYGTPPPYALK